MPKIYSVDRAISKTRPMVELRGRLYEVRDLTMAERLRKMVDLHRRAEEADAQAPEDETPEEAFERGREVVADAVREALKDVPDEVAESITEREFNAIKAAIQRIRSEAIPVDVRDEDEEDISGNVGRRVG